MTAIGRHQSPLPNGLWTEAQRPVSSGGGPLASVGNRPADQIGPRGWPPMRASYGDPSDPADLDLLPWRRDCSCWSGFTASLCCRWSWRLAHAPMAEWSASRSRFGLRSPRFMVRGPFERMVQRMVKEICPL